MLTGTPLDLTFIPELLDWLGRAIPIAWLLILMGCLAVVWGNLSSLWARLVGTVAVLLLLVALPMWKLELLRQQAVVSRVKGEAEQAEFQGRLDKAEALFKKRCETAGEFIYKTVPDVKGVVWMKWRPRETNHGDQFAMNDPYGRDCGEEACIKGLLRSTFVIPNHAMNKPHLPEAGYEFVETVDPRDGNWYRYTAGVMAVQTRTSEDRATATRNNGGVDPGAEVFDFALQRTAISGSTVRYGVTWDDVSTREDRANWIAGGSLSVVDLQSNEVIAKSVGYMIDRGLGGTAGFRSPWDYASSHGRCQTLIDPSYKHYQWRETEAAEFAFKALHPTKGEAR